MQSGLLELIQTFVRVVEVGSFTAVAEELNSSQPTVSRQINALEKQLKARLFVRTTRTLKLTDEGRRFYEQAVNVIEAAERAKDAVSTTKELYGTLRIGGTGAFTRIQIVPRLKRFLDQWPGINIELELNDRIVDIVEQNIDVAIRVGHVTEGHLKAIRIAEMHRITIATPAYLAEHGTPSQPGDLVNHQCVAFSGPSSPDVWTFSKINTGEAVKVKINSRVTASMADAAAVAVMNGLGIGIAPDWAFADAINDGRIVRILKQFEPPPMPIHLVYPSRRVLTAGTKAFIDYLVEEFRDHPILGTTQFHNQETELMSTEVGE